MVTLAFGNRGSRLVGDGTGDGAEISLSKYNRGEEQSSQESSIGNLAHNSPQSGRAPR